MDYYGWNNMNGQIWGKESMLVEQHLVVATII